MSNKKENKKKVFKYPAIKIYKNKIERKMEQVTLGYWGLKGVAEPIRWLLAYLGQEYTEVNPEHAEWPAQKAQLQADGMAFPGLPYLIDGDWKMSESRAIPFYLANKYERPDLFGSNANEMARLKEIEGVYNDIRTEIMKALFSGDAKAGFTALLAADSKAMVKLGYLAAFLGEQEYFLGHITYFDIGFAYFMGLLEFMTQGLQVDSLVAGFPAFAALRQRIEALDAIKAHLASPKGQRPFMPPTMMPWNK